MPAALTTEKPVQLPKLETNPYPWYSPRFWHGMRPLAWWALMASHAFRIHPLRWPMAFLISLITPLNTLFWIVQQLVYGRRIEQVTIEHPPIFIIGHWRSGTTLLHELLVQDPPDKGAAEPGRVDAHDCGSIAERQEPSYQRASVLLPDGVMALKSNGGEEPVTVRPDVF